MDDLLHAVRAVLATTPSRWQTLTEMLPADLLARPAAPNEWSALECLQHLLDTEQYVFPVRVRAILAGNALPSFDPDAQGTTPQPQQASQKLAATFAQLRATNLALLDTLSVADLERGAQHEELGPVTLKQLLNEWAAHDLMHTVQAERALMQPFIAGCDPWRHYFADHDVRQRT